MQTILNYVYIALSQNIFVLPDSSITVNLSKCEKVLCFLCKDKKVPYGSFYEDKLFLDSGVSAYFTLFESDFANMTANLKAPLFMVASGTVLIEHKIFYFEKGTTKVALSKLWPVYCISDIQMHLLSTGQLLQSGLRVEDDKSSSTFCNKSGDVVLLATSNLWGNI